jgi:L-ascorbate metabolism protein UlaG (beta-lactamase superfamily)
VEPSRAGTSRVTRLACLVRPPPAGLPITRLAPPPLGAAALKPDTVVCTHDHMDHLDPVGLPQILALHPSVRVTGPASVRLKAEKLGLDAARVDVVAPGAAVTRGPFRLTAVPAYHSDPETIGLLIEADGQLLYLSSDTLNSEGLPDQLLEAAGGRSPDLALICINGRLGNMNAEEALQVATRIQAGAVVPMHYGLFAENTADPESFVAACRAAGLCSYALQPGVARELPVHVPSLLPPDRNWKLVWHDEFDGETLDTTKWGFRLHLLQKRHETFTSEGAVLDGKGCLYLQLIRKGDHFYSPHLQTGSNYMDRPGSGFCFDATSGKPKLVWPIVKIEQPRFMHRYGYYEIRCKLPAQPGWWTAFWLQSPTIGCSLDPATAGVEVDIMENFTRDGIVHHNNHWNGYGADHREAASGERKLDETPDGFHVFGLHWSPTGYVYYIDGRESWRVGGPVSHRAQFILVSTECMGYRNGDTPDPKLLQAVLPDAFIVDYVRVFDEAP